MKSTFLILLFASIGAFASAQDVQNLKCEILSRFISDEKILNMCVITPSGNDSITIIDSVKAFAQCNSFRSRNRAVEIINSTNGLNKSVHVRNDLAAWQNKVLVYKYEISRKYHKVFYFYKPTNALGWAKYNIRRGKVISVDHQLGQL